MDNAEYWPRIQRESVDENNRFNLTPGFAQLVRNFPREQTAIAIATQQIRYRQFDGPVVADVRNSKTAD